MTIDFQTFNTTNQPVSKLENKDNPGPSPNNEGEQAAISRILIGLTSKPF